VQKYTVPVGPLYIVLTDKVLQSLLEKKQRYPYLPDWNRLLADLQAMSSLGGVPATVRDYQGKNQLLLYTSMYYLALYETNFRDGYMVAHVDSLNLREHERLCKGALWLHAQAWSLWDDVRSMPKGGSNAWDKIYQAWLDLERQRQLANPQEQQQQLTYAHERFLDEVNDLIEVTHQIEQAKGSLEKGIGYKKVESTGGERDIPRDRYVFRLTEFAHLNEKSMLRVRDVPDLKGRVEALEGTKLTLKFESFIDRRRIPEHGYLEPMTSDVIYREQRRAVEQLRTQQAQNVHLLSVLVAHTYLPYQPDLITKDRDEDLKALTPQQFDAFRRALTVPDLLMVLGPPGTGKTRTITEIARYCGLRHQRVLMTAGTHKAVDNVLERMPDDLIVIRVGHEDKVSEKMHSKLIDVQAQTLQTVLLENTERPAFYLSHLLTGKAEIDAWVQRLMDGLGPLTAQERDFQALYQQRTAIEQRISAPFRQRFDELAVMLKQQAEQAARSQRRIETLQERQAKMAASNTLPLLGWLFSLLLNYYASRLAREQQRMQQAQAQIQVLQQQQRSVYAIGQQALSVDISYQQAEKHIHQLTQVCENLWAELSMISRTLQAAIINLVPQAEQPQLTQKSATTLHTYLTWFNATRKVLEQRARLLQDWRTELEKPTKQLYPELMRCADVVGATCIGAATAKGLQDIEFDLVIADEAGQIGLPDLLVPLVRAKRAVLVGDHHQLPPFVDSEVQSYFRNLSPQERQAIGGVDEDADTTIARMTELLTKSAFELLFTAKNARENMVTFTLQGRMPDVIAQFSSRHFYNNALESFKAEKMQHTLDDDPLFRSPLVVVDTSGLSPGERGEQKLQQLESLGETGYTNRTEAALIVALAEAYQRAGREWVVIVPYRAQARLVIKELRKRLEGYDFALEERVATVDSFQGGECKKIIYGFTRSNSDGKIGFLKELRRLNVAMTRAQQHLILIGDFSTLKCAENTRFKAVMVDLEQYAKQNGEWLPYREYRRRLQSVLGTGV
jgi:signal recognition particle GTPase